MQQQKAKEKHALLSTMNSFNFVQNLRDFTFSFILKGDVPQLWPVGHFPRQTPS
jgi:hypothetical protein